LITQWFAGFSYAFLPSPVLPFCTFVYPHLPSF